MNDESRLSSGPRDVTWEERSAERDGRHAFERELGRLRAGIVNALEAFEDCDFEYGLEILCALDDAPTKRVACPRCSLTFEWPGLRDEHLRTSHLGWLGELRAA